MPGDSTISDKTLAILRCPNDQSLLHVAEAALVARLNDAIAARRLKDCTGKVIERSLSSGLVREAGDLVYAIVDDIPVMLYDEAIPLGQLQGTQFKRD